MNGMSDPLAQLRDIHTPDPVAIWPLAPGWWIILALSLLAAGFVIGGSGYWRLSTYRAARRQLKGLRESYLAHHQEENLVVGLSTLIRRYSMTAFGRYKVAGLTGAAWLSFLDRTGDTREFTEGVGRVLKTVPYGGREPVEGEALIGLVEQWLKKARRARP